MGCEKCWRDAAADVAMMGGSQSEHYNRLLEERKDNPCPVVFTGELAIKDEDMKGQWIGVVDPGDHFMPLCIHGVLTHFVGKDVRITVELNNTGE